MYKQIKVAIFLFFLTLISIILVPSRVNAKDDLENIFDDFYQWNFSESKQISNEPTYYSIYYNKTNKQYYILGGQGLLKTSNDGIKWTNINTNTNDPFTQMAYNKKGYVITSRYNTVYYSKDSIHWEKVEIPSGYRTINFTSIAANDSVFVAVGLYGEALISNDGKHWEKVYVDNEYRYTKDHLTKIQYIDGQFVVLGDKYVYSSADGKEWSKKVYKDYSLFEYDPYKSTIKIDNEVWIYNENDANIYFEKNEYIDGIYYLLNGALYISKDDNLWTCEPDVIDFATDGKNVIAIKPNSTIKMLSDNEWKYVEKGNDFYDIKLSVANNKFIFFSDQKLYCSKDGVNWDITDVQINDNSHVGVFDNFEKTDADSFTSNVIWDGKSYYIAANDVLYQSKNGYEWSNINKVNKDPIFMNLFIKKIILVNGEIYGVGKNAVIVRFNKTKNVWDILHYSEEKSEKFIDYSLVDIAYNGVTCVAVSSSGMAYISKDLIKWDKIYIGENHYSVQQVFWDGKQFFVPKNRSVWVSKDGYEWKEYYSDSIKELIVTKDGYIGWSSTGLTGGTISFSIDGIRWQVREMNVLWGINNMVLNGDTILISTIDGRFLTRKIDSN